MGTTNTNHNDSNTCPTYKRQKVKVDGQVFEVRVKDGEKFGVEAFAEKHRNYINRKFKKSETSAASLQEGFKCGYSE
jgi:predicted metal-dependent hydrolase